MAKLKQNLGVFAVCGETSDPQFVSFFQYFIQTMLKRIGLSVWKRLKYTKNVHSSVTLISVSKLIKCPVLNKYLLRFDSGTLSIFLLAGSIQFTHTLQYLEYLVTIKITLCYLDSLSLVDTSSVKLSVPRSL